MKLEAVPNAVVIIVAAGEILQEYDGTEDTRSSDVVGVKYVEAKSGSDFRVVILANQKQFSSRDEKDGIRCRIFLDGMYAENLSLRPNETASGRSHVQLVGRHNHAESTIERFKFADLETSDESVVGVQNERLKHLGEIKIDLTWFLMLEEQCEASSIEFKPAVSGKLPEKCLKGRAVSCMTTLGEAEPATPTTVHKVRWPYGQDPFATFIFKYRSRRDLQIEGIIPRDPSPVPTSPIPLENRDIDELSLEEARERLRRQTRSEEGPHTRVKKEKRDIAHVVRDDEDDVAITEVSSRNKRQRLSSTDKENTIEVSDDE